MMWFPSYMATLWPGNTSVFTGSTWLDPGCGDKSGFFFMFVHFAPVEEVCPCNKTSNFLPPSESLVSALSLGETME